MSRLRYSPTVSTNCESFSVENPDWQDIDDFVGIVNEIANSKAERRTAVFAERCRDTLQQAQCDFVTELEYLQLDIVAWAQEASEKPAAITTALKLAEDLKYNLEEYQDVRPQAESRKEEAERAPARAERESVILRIVDAWRCIFDAKDDRNGDGTIPSVANALDDGSAPAGEQAGGTTAPEEYQDLLSACESLKRERESFRSENDRLQTENNRLAQENAGVEAVKQSLDSEPRTKPLQSRDLGEYWQRFYAASEQLGCVKRCGLARNGTVSQATGVCTQLEVGQGQSVPEAGRGVRRACVARHGLSSPAVDETPARIRALKSA